MQLLCFFAMSLQFPNRPITKACSRVLLRTLLIVPFVLQIFAAAELVGYLSFHNGQKAVNDLATQLHEEVTACINQHLESCLTTPHLVNQMSATAVLDGQLDTENSQSERYLWQQKQYFGSVSWNNV